MRKRGDDLGRSFFVLGCALVTVAAVVVVLLFRMQREVTRGQILSRDVALIESVARLEAERAGLGAAPAFDAVDFALGASELEGIIGLAVLSEEGAPLVLVPETLFPPPWDGTDSAFSARAVWHPDHSLGALFLDAMPERRLPLVEIRVPLPPRGWGGAFQAVYWMDGSSVAREFAELDGHLLRQGSVVFLAFGAVVGGLLFAGYHRLSHARQELLRRQRDLEQANAELLLAAKTSALGVISANLVHGLKNPVAGIERYLASVPGAEDAREAARRMRAILDNTTHMLRGEDRGSGRASFSVGEILEEVRSRVGSAPTRGNLVVAHSGADAVEISLREANLVLLILVNLIGNASEAAGPEGRVRVKAHREQGWLAFEVGDNGPGIPPEIRERLFEPGSSTKSAGSGLGLALSRQLARRMEGDVELAETSPEGTVFILRLPVPASESAETGDAV